MSDVIEARHMSLDPSYGTGYDDRYSWIRSLWLKVIIRALFDYASYRHSAKLSHKKLASNAYDWMFSPNDMFNGFENVCKFLEIDPDKVRERALSMTKDDVAKIEFRERRWSGYQDDQEHKLASSDPAPVEVVEESYDDLDDEDLDFEGY